MYKMSRDYVATTSSSSAGLFVRVLGDLFYKVMRTTVLYLWLLALSFPVVSCRDDGRQEALLRTADSLLEDHPDSALALLRRDSSRISRSGKSVRMWYVLSRTEADDKCYVTHVSDSAIRAAAEYYDADGSALHRVRAHYLLGRVYCDMHLSGHALVSFDKALAVEGAGDPVVSRYKARAATWAGDIYEEKGLDKEALHYNLLSYGHARKADVPSIALYSLRDIGRSYSSLKQSERAISYYRQAADRAKSLHNADLYNMVMEELAAVYLKAGRLTEAYQALQIPFLGTEDQDISTHYFIWANYFKRIGRLDSALINYRRGMAYCDIPMKQEVSLEQARVLVMLGRRAEAIGYYEKYAAYADSVDSINHRETSDLLAQVERNLDIEHRNTDLAESKARLTGWIYAAFFVVSVMIFLMIRYYVNVRSRIRMQQKRMEEYQRRHHKYETQIKRNNERIAQLESMLSSSKESLTALRHSLMRTEVEMLTRQNEAIRSKEKHSKMLEADLEETEVYRRYHDGVSVPTLADYYSLKKALDNAYNNFTVRLKELYPAITNNEMWICCMVKAGLSPKEICRISSYHFNSLGMAKIRLYAKIFHKKGRAKDLDLFIREF